MFNKLRMTFLAASIAVALLICLFIINGTGSLQRARRLASVKSAEPSHIPATSARVGVGSSHIARPFPMSFEQNQGQTSEEVQFLSRSLGYTLFLTHNEAVLSFWPSTNQKSRNAVLKMKFLGANPNPSSTGLFEVPRKSNYFFGNDPRQWHTNIVNYAKVRYQDVYPGIDLVYHGNKNQLEFDFLLAPGAQPRNIQLRFAGADHVQIDPRSGDLVLVVGKQEVRLPKPGVYQPESTADSMPDSQIQPAHRHFIEARYVIGTHNRVSFDVARYDVTRPLVIDPAITYSTYLGGSSNDYGDAIATDASGNAYVVGYSSSTNFPTTTGAYQTQCGSCGGSNSNAFITKLDATGTTLIYSTYLGGSGTDYGNGITVDAAGDVYVVGQTTSKNFPVTSSAFQKTCSNNCSGSDVFVSELDPSGSSLVYSTYLGGEGSDQGNAIRLDSSGNAYITGFTQSTNFPVTPGAFQTTCTCAGKADAFVTALNPIGSALVYSTYIGGSSTDVAYAIDLDSSNNAYITGYTESTNFPTTSGAFQIRPGALQTAFVTKLNSTGTALIYSTYLGGHNSNTTPCEACGTSIAVDSSGDAYVSGLTAESNFPITRGAFQTKFRSSSNGHDAFITKFNSTGTALVYSTYLGGTRDDGAVGIAVDGSGNVWVKGNTESTDFPITTGAFQRRNAGSFDAFVTELNSTGSSLLYSTYLGGSGTEFGGATQALALDSQNPYNVYVIGYTNSTNYPVTIGAFQAKSAGANDAYVAKFSSTAANKAGTGQ